MVKTLKIVELPLSKWVQATWAFALVMCINQGVYGEITVLHRLRPGDVLHRDYFNIPRSKCANIKRQNRCGYYGGFEVSASNKCKCSCPPRSGTIVPNRGTWKCTPNNVMRRIVGCGFHFRTESYTSYIPILSRDQWRLFHAPVSGCHLNANDTRYLGCNGTWLHIQKVSARIELLSDGYDQAARLFSYRVRARKPKQMSGRLVKISLTCQPFNGKPCVVIKMVGKRKCHRKGSVPRTFQTASKKQAADIADRPQYDAPSANVFPVQHLTSTFMPTKVQTNSSVMPQDLEEEEDATVNAVLTVTAVLMGVAIIALAVKLFVATPRERNDEGAKISQSQQRSYIPALSAGKTRGQRQEVVVSSFESAKNSIITVNEDNLTMCDFTNGPWIERGKYHRERRERVGLVVT